MGRKNKEGVAQKIKEGTSGLKRGQIAEVAKLFESKEDLFSNFLYYLRELSSEGLLNVSFENCLMAAYVCIVMDINASEDAILIVPENQRQMFANSLEKLDLLTD